MLRLTTHLSRHLFGLSLLLIGCLSGCQCTKLPAVSNSANVILKKPLSDEEIQKRVTGKTAIPPTSIKIKRCPCDSALINITLPNDWLFEGQGGTVATTPRGGGQSGGGDLDLGMSAINPILSPLEESQFFSASKLDSLSKYQFDSTQLIPIGRGPKDDRKAIRIAVFDSGLDPAFLNGVNWQQPTELCRENVSNPPLRSLTGWNFLDYPVSTNTYDNQILPKHGSRVSYFLAKQFGNSNVPVRIVPMKVLGQDNTGDLFGILCAMETARKNKVDIFNMSLGYYGDRDPVFAEYMKRAVDQGIWVVVAAGNQPNSTEERNLSRREKSFYPAFFSVEPAFDRVIAVTTIDSGRVGASQNFDPKFVAGVKADIDWRFLLLKPGGLPQLRAVLGSSYATPILAGWLGRTLREQPGLALPGVKRQQLIDKMPISTTPGLYQGRYIKRQ